MDNHVFLFCFFQLVQNYHKQRKGVHWSKTQDHALDHSVASHTMQRVVSVKNFCSEAAKVMVTTSKHFLSVRRRVAVLYCLLPHATEASAYGRDGDTILQRTAFLIMMLTHAAQLNLNARVLNRYNQILLSVITEVRLMIWEVKCLWKIPVEDATVANLIFRGCRLTSSVLMQNARPSSVQENQTVGACIEVVNVVRIQKSVVCIMLIHSTFTVISTHTVQY